MPFPTDGRCLKICGLSTGIYYQAFSVIGGCVNGVSYWQMCIYRCVACVHVYTARHFQWVVVVWMPFPTDKHVFKDVWSVYTCLLPGVSNNWWLCECGFLWRSVQLDVWPVYMFIDGCVNAFSPTDKCAFENVWSGFIARHFNNQWLYECCLHWSACAWPCVVYIRLHISASVGLFKQYIPSQWINIPSHWRKIPSHWRNIPSHWRNIPSYWSNIPSHWRNVPSHWRNILSHWWNIPSYWRNIPSHWRNVPSHWRNIFSVCVFLLAFHVWYFF